MESNKPAQNIQDSFLNTARKERTNITIYLLSGVKLTGRIRSFDKYSVVLEASGQEQLIFKHAISTVVMGRTAHARRAPDAFGDEAGGGGRDGGAFYRGGGERLGHGRIKAFPIAQCTIQEFARSDACAGTRASGVACRA